MEKQRLIDVDALIAEIKKNNQENFDEADWTSRLVCKLLDLAAEKPHFQPKGNVIVLPCKAGDTLYAESAIKGHIKSFEAPDIAWIVEYKELFGKEIFLTREEAEKALAKEGIKMARENLWVCKHCLMAIESREGNQATVEHHIDDEEYYDTTEDYEQESKCDWCEEVGFDKLYELI